MKKLRTIFFICAIGQLYGQTPVITPTHSRRSQQRNKIDSLEEVLENKTQFQLKSGYMNKVIFAGRNFGVNQWGGTLGASYHHKSGLNLEYNGNYWSEMDNKYALTDVGGYFEKSLSENFYLTAGYWRLFYTNGDEEERNLFNNFFMLDESWFTPLGQLNCSYYFIHGNETAHRLDVNFSRSFDLYRTLKADKITVEPTATATFATVNYLIFLSSLEEVSVENENNFRIGCYEFSLPVTYKKFGKFMVNATWHYAMPVAFEKAEQVPPVSYFTVEVIRMFLTKKNKKN